jgi:hypothetical protein
MLFVPAEAGRAARAASPRTCLTNLCGGRLPIGVSISRRDVSRHFNCGAKVWWGFHPAHLQRCGHDQGDPFSILLGEDICEIVLFAFRAVHPPEAVLDIPFCHKYLVVLLGLGKCMDNTAKSMPQLIQCALRSLLDG